MNRTHAMGATYSLTTSGVAEVCSPSPRPSPVGRGRLVRPLDGDREASGVLKDGGRFSHPPGERAGVRGNTGHGKSKRTPTEMRPCAIQTPCVPAVLAVLVALACATLQAGAQGIVNFRNKATGLDAPDFDVDCTTKLSGSAFSASLYASPNPDPASMVALGSPVVF